VERPPQADPVPPKPVPSETDSAVTH
jgi:hypothetical protein